MGSNLWVCQTICAKINGALTLTLKTGLMVSSVISGIWNYIHSSWRDSNVNIVAVVIIIGVVDNGYLGSWI